MILEAIMKYLIDMFKKIKSTFVNTNFIKFCLFGVINTFNTALFSQILAWIHVSYNLAATLAYIMSLQIAFLLTSVYIFRAKPNFKRYSRFLLSYLPSFVVYVLLHGVIFGNFNISQFSATMIAVLLSGPITFVIVKFYAFERSEKACKKENDDL